MEGWDDSDLVWVSALEHWDYCPRQCALIHIEQTFDESLYTLRGRIIHERVHEARSQEAGEVPLETGLFLWSVRLGLIGRADVVEFREGIPYPVEYKHGARRGRASADLQLCAQALCLEEMTGRGVSQGAIFYHGSRRRHEVAFDSALRQRVEEAVAAIRRMLRERILPPAVHDRRCRNCSLLGSCLPGVLAAPRRLRLLNQDLFRVSEEPRRTP